jgi:NAD dependent epimerase/dehydratase
MTTVADSTVLVTGAGGFIGSHLVERLVREGARVRALVRYNSRSDWGALAWVSRDVTDDVDVLLGDVRDVESVARAVRGMEYVCHLAAQIAIPYSYLNPRDFFATNVLGSLNFAQAALDAGVKHFVHTSTSEVYGSAQFVPITEDHPLHPQSPYAASKVGADALMESYHRSYGLPVTVLRPFNTFGPRQSGRAVIPTIISQALEGDTVRLGSLTPRRDLTYVADTVEGYINALSAPDSIGRTLHLGTGVDVSVAEIVEIIADIVGHELRVEQDPDRVRPDNSEVTRLLSDPHRAREVIGWTAQVDIREGLRRTVAYVADHAERYRAEQYII